MAITWTSRSFYGHEIPQESIDRGYLDYATLTKAFNAVHNDCLPTICGLHGPLYQESGPDNCTFELAALKLQAKFLRERGEIQNADQLAEVYAKIAALDNACDSDPQRLYWYIISDDGVDILKDADEVVYYNEELEMFLWGIPYEEKTWIKTNTKIKIELDE